MYILYEICCFEVHSIVNRHFQCFYCHCHFDCHCDFFKCSIYSMFIREPLTINGSSSAITIQLNRLRLRLRLFSISSFQLRTITRMFKYHKIGIDWKQFFRICIDGIGRSIPLALFSSHTHTHARFDSSFLFSTLCMKWVCFCHWMKFYHAKLTTICIHYE